jgi:hypothetical protein
MYMAGTYCPYMGAIGVEAKEGWEKNPELVPEGSVVFAKVEQDIKDEQKTTGLTDGQKLLEICFIWHGYAFWYRGLRPLKQ